MLRGTMRTTRIDTPLPSNFTVPASTMDAVVVEISDAGRVASAAGSHGGRSVGDPRSRPGSPPGYPDSAMAPSNKVEGE